MQSWIHDELATANLGDQRVNARYRLLLDSISSKPSLKVTAACRGKAEVKAAYRFVNNDSVGAANIRKLADVSVHAILVREQTPPVGEEAIQWLLLTNLPIANVEQVVQAVGYYCCAGKWRFIFWC